MGKNGWREGTDPAQRWLRIVSGVVMLGVFAALTLDPNRGADDVPTVALALGGLLILLGYEGLIRLPLVGRGREERDGRARDGDELP